MLYLKDLLFEEIKPLSKGEIAKLKKKLKTPVSRDSKKGGQVIPPKMSDREKYHRMYSDYEAASREYANFYNENEIKRENYKTIDAYLIAKANAFNKAYNEGEDVNHTVAGLQYKVKIGAFSDGVPANVINKYLSLMYYS